MKTKLNPANDTARLAEDDYLDMFLAEKRREVRYTLLEHLILTVAMIANFIVIILFAYSDVMMYRLTGKMSNASLYMAFVFYPLSIAFSVWVTKRLFVKTNQNIDGE